MGIIMDEFVRNLNDPKVIEEHERQKMERRKNAPLGKAVHGMMHMFTSYTNMSLNAEMRTEQANKAEAARAAAKEEKERQKMADAVADGVMRAQKMQSEQQSTEPPEQPNVAKEAPSDNTQLEM